VPLGVGQVAGVRLAAHAAVLQLTWLSKQPLSSTFALFGRLSR
jgi:hypothetical protein